MKQKTSNNLFKILTWGCAIITFIALAFIVIYILIKGVPHLKPSLFSFTYTTENVSLTPALISTIIMTALTLAISVPLGVASAIYLAEYAPIDSKIVKIIRLTTETLSGIPSIIYGLFGMLFFVTFLGWGHSLLSGSMALVIMVLPLIIRNTEEALLSVPMVYREGAYALGAGKLITTFKIVLPAAMSGILSGIILAMGRIIGETAVLIYTSGTIAQVPNSLMESARTLSVHMYALSSEGMHVNESYATAVVLLVLVWGLNALSTKVVNKLTRSQENE